VLGPLLYGARLTDKCNYHCFAPIGVSFCFLMSVILYQILSQKFESHSIESCYESEYNYFFIVQICSFIFLT